MGSQTKHNQDAMKNVIYYSDIVQIICVPEKNDDILLYAKLNEKISLKFKKQKIEHLVLTFEDLSGYDDEDDMNEIQQINHFTDTPLNVTTLNGTKESNFCRVFSDLCKKQLIDMNQHCFVVVWNQKRLCFILAQVSDLIKSKFIL